MEADSTGPLDELWSRFVEEARAQLPIVTEPPFFSSPPVITPRGGAESLACIDGLLMSDAQLEVMSPSIPPRRADATRLGFVTRTTDSGAASAPTRRAASAATAQENRALRAKLLQVQQELQAAHARCRRAEQAVAELTAHQDRSRRRDSLLSQQLVAAQLATKKLRRLEEVEASRNSLREQLRERERQLMASGQRCAELERSTHQLKEALTQAMKAMRPEALAASGRR
jgi:hypothetical protein